MWSPTHIQLTVGRCKGLIKKGKSGTNDAYVLVKCGSSKFQTSTRDRSVDPLFNEKCDFPLKDDPKFLKVKVYHRNFLGPDVLLGQACVSLEGVCRDITMEERSWFKLNQKDASRKSAKSCGEIELFVTLGVQSQLLASRLDLNKKPNPIRTVAKTFGNIFHAKNNSKSPTSKNQKFDFNLRSQSCLDVSETRNQEIFSNKKSVIEKIIENSILEEDEDDDDDDEEITSQRDSNNNNNNISSSADNNTSKTNSNSISNNSITNDTHNNRNDSNCTDDNYTDVISTNDINNNNKNNNNIIVNNNNNNNNDIIINDDNNNNNDIISNDNNNNDIISNDNNNNDIISNDNNNNDIISNDDNNNNVTLRKKFDSNKILRDIQNRITKNLSPGKNEMEKFWEKLENTPFYTKTGKKEVDKRRPSQTNMTDQQFFQSLIGTSINESKDTQTIDDKHETTSAGTQVSIDCQKCVLYEEKLNEKEDHFPQKQELINLLRDQKSQIEMNEKRIKELEEYIDNMLAKILENQPQLLTSGSLLISEKKKPANMPEYCNKDVELFMKNPNPNDEDDYHLKKPVQNRTFKSVFF